MFSFGGYEGGFSDPQERIEELKTKLRRWTSGKVLVPLLVVLALVWIGSGIYVVGPGEVGVVMHFGREIAIAQPGLNFRLPWPVQRHEIVDVQRVRSAEIGYRSAVRGGGFNQRVAEEALMLTGDENIVEVQLFVQYIVQDPSQYLFRARDPEATLRAAAEVALRSVVGRNTIDYTMTDGREDVQAQARIYLQKLLDDYQTGLLATAV